MTSPGLFLFLSSFESILGLRYTQRSVKPFVIARKNFLFPKTENGAQASGVLFSIIQTAKANGLCIERYLEYVLNNINKTKIEFEIIKAETNSYKMWVGLCFCFIGSY